MNIPVIDTSKHACDGWLAKFGCLRGRIPSNLVTMGIVQCQVSG